jgi:hypothetical protein
MAVTPLSRPGTVTGYALEATWLLLPQHWTAPLVVRAQAKSFPTDTATKLPAMAPVAAASPVPGQPSQLAPAEGGAPASITLALAEGGAPASGATPPSLAYPPATPLEAPSSTRPPQAAVVTRATNPTDAPRRIRFILALPLPSQTLAGTQRPCRADGGLVFTET